MKQLTATLAISVLFGGVATTPCAWCADEVTVAGVVRDVHGTPLLGALVQLLGQHAAVLSETVSDEYGRYTLRAGRPGEYQLRASGAFLLPITLPHLRLQAGTRAVADLTMLALFEAATVFPAEKRSGAEPSDDWRWTLRSIANRPLLRLADDSAPAKPEDVPAEVLSHADGHAHGRLLFQAGDGQFGSSAAHEEIVVRRTRNDDVVSMFGVNLDGTGESGQATAFLLAAGIQHDRSQSGVSRCTVNFGYHPDLRTGRGAGVQELRAATTERVNLGDQITVDAGTLLTLDQMAGAGFASAPYVRVSVQTSADLRVEYHLATDKALQRTEDLHGGTLEAGLLADASGHPVLRTGVHQEVVVLQSKPDRQVSLAVFRDSVPFEGIQGEGVLPLGEAIGLPVIVDANTQTLRVTAEGVTSTGMALAVSQAMTPSFVVRFDGQVGTALGGDGTRLQLADLQAHLRPLRVAALAGAVVVHNDASGTRLRVHYRWQTAPTLTPVNEFDNESADAFLSFGVRQRLCRGRRFHDVEAMIDANNVLGQGYEEALGPKGQTIRLSQEARSLQGGLAVNF